MSLITAIEPQKNNKRVNIYLDGKFGFGLDLENYVTSGIRLNQELSEDQIKNLIYKAEFQKTLDKLLRFATLRPRSENEINNYLKRKKVDGSLYGQLFDRLNRLELLDDEKFARWWLEQRLQFKNKSKRELIQELRVKGIDSEIIKKTIDDMDISDEKAALKLVEKRLYRWQKYEEAIKRQKISQYLASKGFDWNVISDVLKYLLRS